MRDLRTLMFLAVVGTLVATSMAAAQTTWRIVQFRGPPQLSLELPDWAAEQSDLEQARGGGFVASGTNAGYDHFIFMVGAVPTQTLIGTDDAGGRQALSDKIAQCGALAPAAGMGPDEQKQIDDRWTTIQGQKVHTCVFASLEPSAEKDSRGQVNEIAVISHAKFTYFLTSVAFGVDEGDAQRAWTKGGGGAVSERVFGSLKLPED